MKKSTVKVMKVRTNKKDERYILIAKNPQGKSIAFAVDNPGK